MRRILIVSLVLALCLGVVIASGCNDDTAQAKTYMEKADQLSRSMRLYTGESAFDVAGLLAELGIEVGQTGTVDKQKITETANETLDLVVSNGEKAKDEYDKILALKGAEAYKKYAEARIKAINNTIAVLEPIQGLLDEIGSANNKDSVSTTLANWAKANVGVAIDAVKAFTSWRDADKIKKENNLGPAEEVVKDSVPVTTTPE